MANLKKKEAKAAKKADKLKAKHAKQAEKTKSIKKTNKKATHRQREKVMQERFHDWIDSWPVFDPDPTKLRFWRDTFIVFIAAGFVGHVIDLLWRMMMNVPIETWIWQLTPLVAEPYGFAAVALLWFVYPLARVKKIGAFAVYLIGTVVTTAVELICGLVLMAAHDGYNPYWDYSHLPFNLFGQVCLYNSIMFGVASIAFVYFAFPWFDSKLRSMNKWVVNGITLAVVLWYATSLMFQMLAGFRIII